MNADLLARTQQPGFVDPELAEILRSGPPVGSLDATTNIPELRKLLRERKLAVNAAAGNPSSSLVEETDTNIRTRDNDEIRVRIYRSSRSTGLGPVMVMLHGGGWVLGDLDNEALLCRKWVDYLAALAPEHVFPTAVYDSYDAVLWIQTAKNAVSFGGDLTKGFVVAGVSAGANMTATLSHLYRDEGHAPPITGLYLSIPSLLAPEAVPDRYKESYRSRDENKDAPVLNERALKLFRNLYQDDPRSPLMSPFVFETGHENLPPTYFQVGGMDPLRDEALIYERVLREEHGIATRVDLYPGLPHGFWSWWPNAEFSKKHARDSIEGLRWLLSNRAG
ncbi:hypothetical protein H2200_005583 [Cladophialophora chaetospira]|uniref:Alpha/beta hydrolase fold-3 domain-containing protein n=1 Tax=Cladophialophora chaetospira TaxID=386627 RepID=A0AA38XCF1_9EURO|nr:hypothetical protein H2200_005583 [Cladophialophora chaetospira]